MRPFPAVGRRLRTGCAAVLAATMLVAAGGCGDGADDGRVRLTIGTFNEFGYEALYEEYMAEHPNIVITERVANAEDHHNKLAAHLATDTGSADIEAIEEGWMGQYIAAPNRFVDLRQHGGAELRSRWPEWKWKAGSAADGRVIGFGTDVGGLAMCYRKDLFAKAGLPTERDDVSKLWPTWEKYIATGQAFKKKLPDTAFLDGSAPLYRAILGQATVGLYDGDRVAVGTNPAVKRAWDLTAQASQSNLTARAGLFSQDWNVGLAKGGFATLTCPSWMLAFIQRLGESAAGIWDVAKVPGDSGNWGGSWLTVPRQGRHHAEAVALAAWLTAPEQQAKVFRSSGNFPSTLSLYSDRVIQDFKSPFFNNAPLGKIFADSVRKMRPQFMGPKSGDLTNVVQNGLARIEQGKEGPDASWAKVLKEVEALS